MIPEGYSVRLLPGRSDGSIRLIVVGGGACLEAEVPAEMPIGLALAWAVADLAAWVAEQTGAGQALH